MPVYKIIFNDTLILQLSMTRKEKRALHELQEMEISFPPTYKLRQGADRSGGKTDYNLK